MPFQVDCVPFDGTLHIILEVWCRGEQFKLSL